MRLSHSDSTPSKLAHISLGVFKVIRYFLLYLKSTKTTLYETLFSVTLYLPLGKIIRQEITLQQIGVLLLELTLSILLKTLLHLRAKYLQYALEIAPLTALNTVIENFMHFGFM